MQTDTTSNTAIITAFARAYHARAAATPLFDDNLAEQMLAPGAYEFLSTAMTGLLAQYAPHLADANLDQEQALAVVMRRSGWASLLRSRFTEDHLALAVEAGIGQYVILGAGFDTFAYREPELAARIQVFELDHPATQTAKGQRIAELGWRTPGNVHSVPIDFTTQRLDTVLLDAGYDQRVPTFVSWLGVTYYLSREVVFETLARLATVLSPGSLVAFDYFDDTAMDQHLASESMVRLRTLVANCGEPILSTLDPARLDTDLRVVGFHLHQQLTPAEVTARYLTDRSDGTAPDHLHLAMATRD